MSRPAGAIQPSLFDDVSAPGDAENRFRPLDECARRTDLTAGAWVDSAVGWLAGSVDLLERLRDTVPWRAERRQMYDRVVDVPRLVCFYGEDDALPDPVLAEALRLLNARYAPELGEPLVTAGLCYYRDGDDSVAWHGDTIGRGRREDTIVAILSLGASRPLHLRPRGGGPSLRFPAGHGDLAVMGGSCQRTWEHRIAKSVKATGPRISVQFRPRGVR